MQTTRLGYPKRNNRHAGFAFVEFETKQEALNAKMALSDIHLYGRPLVSLLSLELFLGCILDPLCPIFAGARVGQR